jgi:hypothetical protein
MFGGKSFAQVRRHERGDAAHALAKQMRRAVFLAQDSQFVGDEWMLEFLKHDIG